MSKVNEYKALLRGVLNAGIASEASAEKTIEALDIQFAGICMTCMLSNIGYKCPCERGKVCFVEDALEHNYKRIAREKCVGRKKNGTNSI